MERTKKNNLTLALTIVYLIAAVWIILLKMSSFSEIFTPDRVRSLNLIPFYYDTENGVHLSEVLANVAIFIPLGVYLRMLGVPAGKTVLAGFGLSLAFETAQYFFAIGAWDITDLITNTAGAAAGVLLYGLFTRLFRDARKRHRALNVIALTGTAAFLLLFAVILFMN